MTAAVEKPEDAERIAGVLLAARLAACVQITGAVASRYRWEGRLETSTEHLLVIKTTAARARAVVEAVIAAHPYEVPEVLVTPVLDGHDRYLEWVRENVD